MIGFFTHGSPGRRPMIYEGECRGDSKRGALPAHANPRKMAVKCLHGKISKNRLDSTFCQNCQRFKKNFRSSSVEFYITGNRGGLGLTGEVGDIFSLCLSR